jgi:hypothetical protein
MFTVRRETAVLARRFEMPVALVTVPPFCSFASQLLQTGAEPSRLGPGLNFLETVPAWSAPIITDEMIAAVAGSFQSQTSVIARLFDS